MILDIKTYPNKILKQKTKRVEKIDKEIEKLIGDMIETMYAANGAGLAANQVGVAKQILVFDDGKGLKILINPKISARRGKITAAEGCLSFPGLEISVKRPEKITVEFMDRQGTKKEMKAQGLAARIICHEADHLAGRTIIDNLGLLKKLSARRKYLKSLKK
jgi:peptide deformylase